MLAMIEFKSYDNRESLAKLTKEQYEYIRLKYPKFDIPEDSEKLKDWWTTRETLVDDTEMMELTDYQLKYNISKIRGVANLESSPGALHKTIYQVSVANVGLFEVKSVMALVDICTEELQKYLDKGWRLLAVCPPNDARRPSYILGHTDWEAEQ